MKDESIQKNKEDKYVYPPKKYIDLKKDKQDISDNIQILTNLTKLEINKDAIKGIYLYGCDLSEETDPTEDFNPVHIMRKARRLEGFRKKIKEYIENYYVAGLILMGKPIDPDKKHFKFYLVVDESKEVFDGEIFDKLPENIQGKIYKFKFKRKKEDLSTMDEDKNSGEAQCVANYLNICLGKILKKCDYTKDRTSRKILYYQKKSVEEAQYIGDNKEFMYFPALKAVCETYEGGKIYMKLLPKNILKKDYTYGDYFYDMKCNSLEERFNNFREKIINKKGITVYNQVMIKIEDVIFENPYTISFIDKSGTKWNVGDYLTQKLHIKDIYDEKIPIAVRIIDKGGKLKGEERKFIHIPCRLLAIVGNAFKENIDIKDLVQNPNQKLNEINRIRILIEEKSKESQKEELHNYLGTKFDPVTVNGQIITPPIIKFGDNKSSEINNGNIQLNDITPYSKIKELNKVDIYTLHLQPDQYEVIWGKLEEASLQLGIKFKVPPTFYSLDPPMGNSFRDHIEKYFNELNDHYLNCNKKKENDKEDKPRTDFIFFFMDQSYKDKPYYSIFKSIINKYDWCIPTQVILYNEKKIKYSKNLSQFTNILCQMWAKQGNELYICDFSFVPQTLVIAYSTSKINKDKSITSVAISIGTKLYEYIFFSTTSESEESNISPSLYSILFKAFKTLGKILKKPIHNIVIYRDAVNDKQQELIKKIEIPVIKKVLEDINIKIEKDLKKDETSPFKQTKWILILVSKLNEIKMFLEDNEGNNNEGVSNIPVGTLVDRVITNQDKYDFYLNSAESRQGTCSSTHYIILHDDTTLSASQIYKLTYYLTFLSYNTTKSIRVPSPLYFVTRRNQFTISHLNGELINQKSRTLNISL